MIVKHSHTVNHYDALNLTKLDVLDTFDEIPIATGYRVDGQVLEYFPADLEVLSRVEVIYTTLPGWSQSTTGITEWEKLPENARKYVAFIEDYLKGSKKDGPKCKYIGTGKHIYHHSYAPHFLILIGILGPKREDTIFR